MAFPEFDPGKRRLLFFSRGRGRGHAIPDIEIVKELSRLRDDVCVRFVSYGTGARTLEEFGQPLIDLGLPEMNGTAETTVLAGKAIGWLQPDLVVSHEEFAALPAAKIFDRPTIFLTHWFTDPDKFSMQSLRFADRVLFLGGRGLFPEPEWVQGKVDYVGPVVREFEYSRKDRLRAREELGLPRDSIVIAVLPGSWTERMSPLFDLLIAAFDGLRAPDKHLLWLAGEDCERLSRRTRKRKDVTVLGREWRIDRLMAAADLAITKANRTTVTELEALGIRQLSISHGHNPIDDACTRPMRADQLTAAKLTRAIGRKLSERAPRPRPAMGAARVSAALSSHIECAAGSSL